MGLLLVPIKIVASTDISGSATVLVRVPGTFSGMIPDDPSAGRFFKKLKIWADVQTNGDCVSNLCIIDQDGLIPGPARAHFPLYPIIRKFGDVTNDGFWLPRTSETEIENDGDLIPSGMYISGTFTAGDGASDRVFRANLLWSQWVPDQ